MHFPWIRSVRPNRQLPGVAPEIFHWSFDRPNGCIIEGDTGSRSVNFNGTWIQVGPDNWAARLQTNTGATTELPVIYQSNIITIKFRFRPLSYSSGGEVRYLYRSGASPNNNCFVYMQNSYNSLYFNSTDAGGGTRRLSNIHTTHPADGSWYDVVVSHTTWAWNTGNFGGGVGGTTNNPRVWINGVEPAYSVEGGGATYHEWFNHRVLTIGNGGYPNTTTNGFHCDLDYFKIFRGYQTYPATSTAN